MPRKRKLSVAKNAKYIRYKVTKRHQKETTHKNVVDAARAVGHCCVGNLCQHPTLQLISEITFLKWKGYVHVLCAIWDNNTETYVCQQI